MPSATRRQVAMALGLAPFASIPSRENVRDASQIREYAARAVAELVAAVESGQNAGITKSLQVYERTIGNATERRLGDGFEITFRIYDTPLSEEDREAGWN